MADKYNLIVGLGATPLTSQMLKLLEMQIFDFPFDFISGGDFFTRMNFFLSNCNNFIQQKNIVMQKDTPVEGNTQFKDLESGFIYHIDFNPELPVENNFPGVKTKYDKYIRHLNLSVRAAKKILIVYIEDPLNKEDDEQNMALVLEATHKLKEKYPKKEFRIMYVQNDEDAENIKYIQIGKDAEKICINFYRKFSEASARQIDLDILGLVFEGIELKKTWQQKKLFFYQKLLNSVIRFRQEHKI